MTIETREEVLEKVMALPKPKCPHCGVEMSLWEEPPMHMGDGLGWGTPFLFICFSDDLQTLLDGQYRAYSAAMTGTCQRVLVTGRAARDARELAGRTDNNRVVNFAGDPAHVGSYVDVTITAALPHSLRGELAAPAGP